MNIYIYTLSIIRRNFQILYECSAGYMVNPALQHVHRFTTIRPKDHVSEVSEECFNTTAGASGQPPQFGLCSHCRRQEGMVAWSFLSSTAITRGVFATQIPPVPRIGNDEPVLIHHSSERPTWHCSPSDFRCENNIMGLSY